MCEWVVDAAVDGREVGIGLDTTRWRTDCSGFGVLSTHWILGLRTRSAQSGSSRLAMDCRSMGGVPLLLCACEVAW